MTNRRIDKTRKLPRRPAARPAARPVDSTRTGEISSSEISSAAPPSDTPPPVETVASDPTAAAEPVATAEPVTPPGAEAEALGSGIAEIGTVASEDAPEQAEGPLAATAAEAAPADDADLEATRSALPGEAEAHHAPEEIAPKPVARESVQEPAQELVQEPVQTLVEEPVEEPVAPADDVAEGPVAAEPAPEATDSAVVAATDDQASAPTAATPETLERPAAADRREEIPLAAMQGLIEINGRLVAFMQGEGQAAVAFWKAAMTVRSPGDLAQLQAAEVSRAFDAALACWTDVARRMGRFTARARPGARAA